MYAFIQEELLYNSVNKPELRTPTLFVDSSHIQTESMMMQRSARLVIEKEYIGSMRLQAIQFYLYSFHPHTPIRSVCSRIMKAIRGRESETVVIISSFFILLEIFSRSCTPAFPVNRAKHRSGQSSDGSLRVSLSAELFLDGIHA